MGTNLQWALDTMKKCFVAPSTLDISKADGLAVGVAMTRVEYAIKNGELTTETFEKFIMGEFYRAPKTEIQHDSIQL